MTYYMHSLFFVNKNIMVYRERGNVLRKAGTHGHIKEVAKASEYHRTVFQYVIYEKAVNEK
jgi:hypothetical protein